MVARNIVKDRPVPNNLDIPPEGRREQAGEGVLSFRLRDP